MPSDTMCHGQVPVILLLLGVFNKAHIYNNTNKNKENNDGNDCKIG